LHRNIKSKCSFTSFMLSRRHLRIKVMQALYAYAQTDNADLVTGEKELIRSIEKLYELFIYQLSFIIEIFEFGERRIEESKLKFLPTQEDLNPNTKFINNKFIKTIRENAEYRMHVNKLKISWHEEEEMIRTIYNKFRNGKEYQTYMDSEDSSFKADKDIVIKLFKKYITTHSNFVSYCEEKNIYWANDFPVSTVYLIKSLKAINEGSHPLSPFPNFHNQEDQSEDYKFIKELFRKTILMGKDYDQMISDKAKNWELERIALMDMILLKMALTEFVELSNIPVKVSFNEYIEISKEFSTPKSKTFINGILDKLIIELTANGKIKKTGRGLVE